MTYRQATYISLRKYRAALAAGEREDWDRADVLTDGRCAFCRAKRERDGRCDQCPVDKLCLRSPQIYAWHALRWNMSPATGRADYTSPAKALAGYRVVIRGLEKLQAKYRAEK